MLPSRRPAPPHKGCLDLHSQIPLAPSCWAVLQGKGAQLRAGTFSETALEPPVKVSRREAEELGEDMQLTAAQGQAPPWEAGGGHGSALPSELQSGAWQTGLQG